MEGLAALQYFRILFPSDDYVEDLLLSRLHRIILEVIPGDLQEELQKSSNAEINMNNTGGRSALSWAALRGDHTAVMFVFEAGAYVDQSEVDRETPQLYSIERDNATCMELLLKADPDSLHRNNRGRDALLKALDSMDKQTRALYQASAGSGG